MNINIFITKIINVIFVLKVIKGQVDGNSTVSAIPANPESIVFIPNTRVFSEDEYLEDKKPGIIDTRAAKELPTLSTSTPENIFLPGETVFMKANREKSTENFGSLPYITNDKPRSVYDLMNNAFGIRVETGTENSGNVFFVTGGNVENIPEIETNISKEKTKSKPTKLTKTTQVLDCKNLTCTRNFSAVCGEKIENNKLRYRLFYNECHFRKVNCAFKFETNRFKLVDLKYCDNIPKNSDRPYGYNPVPNMNYRRNNNEQINRNSESRRSLNVDSMGNRCSHFCPKSCTEDYVPECAISIRRDKRVFVNHCQLDLSSCKTKLAWHTLPLVECIGYKQVETRENRSFIAWMQKVGIIDAKGRLIPS